MIERKFVAEKIKELQINEYIIQNLKNVGLSHTKLQRTPLGEKIIIFASRPGLVVGRKGQNIKKMTLELKKKFNLENPQIEISEVENINIDPRIVAERISSSMERFGSARFKGIGHKVMTDVINSGAMGIELLISGKIPSARAKVWRFYQGYLKKCGNIALTQIKTAYTTAELKTGTVGIQVRIMPSDVELPDNIEVCDELQTVVEEVKETAQEPQKEGRKERGKEKKPKKEGEKPKERKRKQKQPKEESTEEKRETATEGLKEK